MKNLTKRDVQENADLILELPAFVDLKSKDGLKNIFTEVLSDIYINQPKELFDYMKYNLNDRMMETILTNYGIDRTYSKKVNKIIKKSLVFYLEKLFQAKGSREILGLFAQIFENFFEKINFYNIIVDKLWTGTDFEMQYRLQPISIADNENILTHVNETIGISKKYMMSLSQFNEYKLFPINTNIIYIQFSGGEGTLNNSKTFTDGVRAYAATSLQQEFVKYTTQPSTQTATKSVVQIDGSHLETLITYFKLSEIRRQNPTYDFNSTEYMGSSQATSLIYDKDLIPELEDILYEYSSINKYSRKELSALKRRWQNILRLNVQVGNGKWSNFLGLEVYLTGLYPTLIEEFKAKILASSSDNNESLMDFYTRLYTSTLNDLNSDKTQNSFIQLYINTMFMRVISGSMFIDSFFKPVFEIFVKYFFPIEMEYLNTMIDGLQIKDKWNTIATDEYFGTELTHYPYSNLTPVRGLDKFYTRFTTVNIELQHIRVESIPPMVTVSTNLKSKIYSLDSVLFSYSHYMPDIIDIKNNFIIKLFSSWTSKISEKDGQIQDSVITSCLSSETTLTLREIQDTVSMIVSTSATPTTSGVGDSATQLDNIVVKQTINKIDLINGSDLIDIYINYGDYYTYTNLSNYDLVQKLMERKFGSGDWSYETFYLEQKNTYGKYLYIKTQLWED